eukprot:TRINITY_DN25174_c0_g1_i1.p1 TRINITY_DN25174_c0_g1~~TRINITY_DN25174_c0_g1_i1.p1  ORF type:complete len:561 (+),score=105.78 TRINITY_DN25174_c0_g1_i1:50-1684(+)
MAGAGGLRGRLEPLPHYDRTEVRTPSMQTGRYPTRPTQYMTSHAHSHGSRSSWSPFSPLGSTGSGLSSGGSYAALNHRTPLATPGLPTAASAECLSGASPGPLSGSGVGLTSGGGLTSGRNGWTGSRTGGGGGGARLPLGLTNLGNTCFMNAVLQCLIRTPLLARGMADAHVGPTNKGLHGDLSNAFKRLVHDTQTVPSSSWGDQGMLSGHGLGGHGLGSRGCSWGDPDQLEHLSSSGHHAIKPVEMFNAIRKWRPSFSGYGQQDAQEFLRFTLEGIHEELNKVLKAPPYEELNDRDEETTQQTSDRWWRYHTARDDSLIYDIFGGQLKSDTQCQECHTHHYAFDPYLDLSVPLPKQSSSVFHRHHDIHLTDCLKQFAECELLDGSNMYRCRNCKRPTRAVKQLNVYRLPQCLVVHVKRFAYGQSKLDDPVAVPLTLDMEPYLDVSARHLPENAMKHYRLYGVVNHIGSLHAGHYTSWVRGAGSEWHQYDDATVSTLPSSYVPPTSDRPYLLFYEKCPPGAGHHGLPPVHRDVSRMHGHGVSQL